MTRRRARRAFWKALVWAVGLISLCVWLFIAAYILVRGLRNVDVGVFMSGSGILYGKAGNLAYALNTLYLIVLTLAISLPLGVGACVYVNMYLKSARAKSIIQFILDIVLGTPTVVTGLFGLTLFSRYFGLKSSLWAGALTMSITMVPLIMYTMRDALQEVPVIRIRQATAMGANTWHLIRHIVLPECLPAIRYAAFLAASRVVAESTALLLAAGAGGVMAGSFLDAYASSGATLAVRLYMAVQHEGDLEAAFSAAAMLLVVVFALNLLAIWSRKRWKLKNL